MSKEQIILQTTETKDKIDKSSKFIIKQKYICIFCKDINLIVTLHPFNLDILKLFLNSKHMIKRYKCCFKHMRKVRKVIIQARHLHLLPYISY